MPQPQECILFSPRYDLDLWPHLTLKTFSAIPTRMMNICAKFHWNPPTKYRDIALCVNGHRTNGRPDGQPVNTMLSAHYCWRMHRNRWHHGRQYSIQHYGVLLKLTDSINPETGYLFIYIFIYLLYNRNWPFSSFRRFIVLFTCFKPFLVLSSCSAFRLQECQ